MKNALQILENLCYTEPRYSGYSDISEMLSKEDWKAKTEELENKVRTIAKGQGIDYDRVKAFVKQNWNPRSIADSYKESFRKFVSPLPGYEDHKLLGYSKKYFTVLWLCVTISVVVFIVSSVAGAGVFALSLIGIPYYIAFAVTTSLLDVFLVGKLEKLVIKENVDGEMIFAVDMFRILSSVALKSKTMIVVNSAKSLFSQLEIMTVEDENLNDKEKNSIYYSLRTIKSLIFDLHEFLKAGFSLNDFFRMHSTYQADNGYAYYQV